MTSQRWTRISPPIFPFALQVPLSSPGPQQTGCQVALPALPKVLPLIPLPPSSLLTHTETHTQHAPIHARYSSSIKPSINASNLYMICVFEKKKVFFFFSNVFFFSYTVCSDQILSQPVQ